MGFGFFRTIWITLRAANYTTQAFDSTIRGLSKLQQEQLRLKMNAAKNMMAVGTMYLALGAIAMMTFTTIMAKSEAGQAVMQRFSLSTGKSMEKLGESFAKILGPIFDVVAKILELATANPIVRDLLAGFLLLGGTLIMIAGIVKMVAGVIGILKLQMLAKALVTKHATITLDMYSGSAMKAAGASMSLSAALGAVVAGFTAGFAIVLVIQSAFGRLPAIIAGVTIAVIGLAVAIIALSGVLSLGATTAQQLGAFGVALAAGGAMGAAFVASQPEYQMGTRAIAKTGMFYGHKGEVLYNPENQLPTQVNRDLNRPSTTYQKVEINMSGMTVQTKADREELLPMIERALRKKVLSKE